jgi:alkanesulfonate monooxygenase SsuD/methylene tetrahydromethanopterin reductase-like flavin-dependent oxidoreductase (luciferase family)
MTSDLRVGVQYTPRADQNISSIVRAAVEIEAMGYDTISLPDHLTRVDGGQVVALPDPVALVARLAADTRTIGLGTMTLLDALRHPAQILRTAATLQRITAGRFELGLGAGWLGSDLAVLGGTAQTRLDTLTRTLALIRHAWPGPGTPAVGENPGDSGARAAAAANAAGIPAPVLVVAAGGPRMLRLAAATADVVALTVPTWDRATGRPTAASVTAQMDIVRRASPVGLPAPGFHLQIRELPAATPADSDADWWIVGGSPAEAAEALRRRIDAGVGYLSVCSNDLQVLGRFADTVLPLVMP